jgi:hypothetical protein
VFACLTSYTKLEGLVFGDSTTYVFGELNPADFNIQFLLSDPITPVHELSDSLVIQTTKVLRAPIP